MSYIKLFFARLIPFFKQHPQSPELMQANIAQISAYNMATHKILVLKKICTQEELNEKIDESLKQFDLGILGGQAVDLE